MHKAHGFTIVELLIVIVVIAILAALSYVGYTSISNRAHDAAVQSDLANIAKKMKTLKIEDPNDRYPNGNIELEQLQISISTSSYDTTNAYYNLLGCVPLSTLIRRNHFTFIAQSKSGKYFYVSDVGSVKEYTSGPLLGGTDINTYCAQVNSTTDLGYGAGYLRTEGWRSWTQ